MAFLRQLKLLLWKNGLAVVRQPLWSLTLIIWPVIIFMIIAVTRKQFPPVIKETCFVGPRNLPSAGFFPFLQTLMCNTDSNCNNKSLSVDPAALKSTNRGGTRLNQLLQPADFTVPKNYKKDSDALIEALSSILGPFHQQGFNNVSHMNPMNTTLLGDQESLNKLLESMNMLKRAICTMTLSTMNTTSHNPLSYAVVTFCKSNNTVFEVSLNTLNQMLTELMVTKPNETMTVAAAAVMVFDKLQNHTSLWESLLAIPQLLSSGSFDQVLASAEVLLTNVQGAMNVIQNNFPEVGASLSTVHPLLAGGINMIRYAQKWPGRGVSITLGDVVTLQNDSLSEMVKRVLQEVKIPLDKAIGLTFDRDMVLSHLCENSSNPLWLTAACSTGTVNMLLGFISPDKVAKQILLVWSERVAPHDVSFAKGLLHSLMGGPSPGGQGGTRNRRSVETQPQNIEEELFLGVGKVVMEIIQTVPELDMVVDALLRTGFQFMQSATLGLDTVEEMMENFLKDANQIQMTYLSLMTNQSAASVCISRILDGVMGILPKVMSTQSLTCEDLFGHFEWLLNTESIKIEVLRSAICQNSSALQEALLMNWLPLIQKGQDLYIALTGQGNYNLTLPMILSEWHKLYNKSMQFGMRSNRLAAQLSGEYWINWMVDNSTQDVPGILQQSVFLFMVNVGENIEKSQLWPEVKDYFHMLYWILNYRPDVTTQPANCSIDINYLSIHCNTGLKWPQFVQAMTQALMSPSQDVLVNCLKGTVNLLQNAYGDVYRNLVGTYLKQEIQGGDALSAYLINLMKNLDGFINTITMLPDQSNVTIALIGNLLQSTGLRPLLPLLLSDGPLNASALLDVASKLGRLNQHIFTFNETDPTMPELERLIMLFLSLEGNLTMSLSHIMGNTELTYSDYFHPDYVARLRQAIEPFTNQTSAGFVETILSAMELLKKMLDAPNGDPTNIILEYTRQLQEFLKALYRLQKIQHQGQLSPAQVTDLHSLSKDFLDLLTQEGLQNLTQAGPDAAQNIVAQKLVAFLPPEVRQEAARFLQDFKALQYQIAKCAAGQNCLAGISEIFTFLDQISELMLSANVNVTITLAATNLVLEGREYEEITSLFFPLLLSSNDASYVESFKQTLHFIRLIMATPNITVSDVQNALQQSNLTLGELNNIAALAGAANINDLIGNIMQIIDARQCFEPQHNPMVTTQCVMGLISGVSSFLTHLPAFRNETAILSLIPLIINNTISDGVQVDFSSNPNLALAHILNRTLANIKMSFQLNHMYTPEIMKEIRVVEGLIRLVANTDPFDNLNTSLLMNSGYAQKIYLEIVEWYLKRLENITSTSSASELLAPFYHFTQMQVTSQLAHSEFSLFISKQVEFLINSLQYPIDGAGVRQIGLTTVEILRRQFDLIILEVEAQNNFPGSPPLHNTTALHVIKLQVKLYLDTIEMWMKQPNVLPVLSSMLQWGNPSINVSTPVTDIQHLLGTMVNVLSADQQAYLSIISNITKSLSEALMVAEQPGGPQSDHFLAAILEAVQKAMQVVTAVTGPLPLSVQQNILEIVGDSVKLAVHPQISFASSRNISLLILKRVESVIQQTLPEIAEYLLPALKVATTYFQSISAGGGPNVWNQLILDEMKTIQSLLPPNSSAQAYVSVLINITHFILESGQGNMSLWAMFESASVENLPMIFGQSVHFLPAIVQSAIQTLTGATAPLPLSVQQDILEIVQDSLKLIQPNMSFASSRNISLLILMRAESIIKQTLPEIAEYLLPALEVATQYFESISAASGPNIWNQLILDEMKTIQSLLPPNSSAQAYVCALINITHFILESGQGNMSLWAMFESASVENLPMIFGQSVHFLSAIVQSAIQTLTGATAPLPPSVQQDIMEIVQDSLKLIQPDIGFASSRNISLLILKRAESIIKQTLPEIAEYLLPALEVATQYFESISAASGPNIWNQLILDEINAIQSLLPPNSSAQAYVCTLINITHFILESGQGNMSLWASFENASGENLPMIFGQNVHFLAAIVQSAIQTLTGATGPLPLSVQQDIMEIVQDSLKLTQPDISFASSRNISLLILKRAESIIKQTLPEIAEYLLPALEIPTMYFESISAASGPNIWYQLILGEMTADQSFLPPNSPAQAFVSVLINITHFILESGQGNMSLWAGSESSSENLPMIFDQIGKLLSSLWALIMGDPGSPVSPPSLGVFAHLAPVLEQLLTEKANQQTWEKLEKILEALLSTFKGTEPWDPSVIPMLEKIIGSIVNNIQGQNALILSLQTPLLTLIGEITQTVNGSHFNLSDVSEEMQHAIERTLKAAEQANGTLGCGEVLKAWEPVREASGLSQATVYMWCNISLQPVLKAYAASQAVYTHMNMSQMGGGPMNVSTTSAGIVKAVQSFYQANINSSLVTERVISAILSQLSQLAGRPLSHEAQLYLYKQLQDMQLQNSLSSFKMLTDELVSVAPFIQPYVEAVERALRHILGNYHLLQNSSSSQDLFREAAMIFLSAANITADDIFPMMWGDLSGPNAASLPDMLRQAVRLVIDMEIFGDAPMVYRALERFLASNVSSVIAQKLTAMCAWLTSTQASGLDLLTQALPKIYDILRPLLSVLTQMGMDMPANAEPFEDLAGNILAMLRQLMSTSGLMTPMSYHPSMYQQHNGYGNHTGRVRNRRESPLMMMAREPMDDFIDLFQIDYPAMFRAISVPVTTAEITETVQMVFANPDLSVVIKGSTRGIPGDSSAFREKTIDAGLGLLSFFTLPAAVQMSSMDLLANAANVLPAGFPFSSALKNITRALAGESQGNLMLMAETFQKAAELFQISPMDPRFAEQLGHLRSKVCTLEKTQSVRQLMLALSIEPGQLCHTVLPSLQILTESLTMNTTALTDAIFQAFIGDPQTYNVQSNWSSVLTRGLGFNTSSLSSFNINITSPGAVTVGEMLRNKAAFVEDVQKHMNFDTAALHLLMETTLPNNNLEILSWLINLRHCSSAAALNMEETDVVILNTFCSLSVGQWYSFSLLMARHLNMEKLIYRMVLSEELQSLVRVMLQMAEVLTNMMDTILPAIGQLQTLMLSMNDIDLMADPEFRDMVRGRRETLSSQATFVTLSRALCSKGIVALLGISKLPATPKSNSFSDPRQREEMIERFKIPQDATPFCMNMYLDMVNTTGGAIAWAFLKPMLMGNILFTPDTPTTRAIMEKANGTLKEFGNLRKYSEDWLESSNYIMKSAEILGHTLPMLQNSLGNSFVVNFIEMQTDINVGRMKETLSNFSNMTVLLEKNKHIMKQITTLSTLMVNISSCIKFDRYRGFDSANELDTVAQDLAKNRDLYASVIFKLPKDEGSSRKRQARSSSSTSPLPPKVRYTIRMHMDNVMRTDRVRNPYYVKDNHISARLTLRYNRGFVYLQENIDRAIIETQTGQRVADPAVQLQPFPYPCFYRDEYLEAISFVFPVMLMLAWVLFVADFVKKLVYERELRLHEYMKMMGVNPLSHFFAWFLECATYLVLTIFLLTLVLKFGSILPNSDGFLLFLYLCDYGLSILSFSYLVSSFFDKTYIAGLSGSLLYILCFFPFIVVLAVETKLTFFQKSALSLFSPTCFSYASQYISRYEAQGEGILWSNSYTSPIAGDMASFGWLCWLMLIDSILYFIIGAYIRMVFPGKYGIPAPWYFPFKASFWADLCCCIKSNSNVGRGLLFTNIMQTNQPVFSDDKGKGKSTLTSQAGEDFSELPVGVALHGLSKSYGDRVAIENLNVSFYEGHVTSLLGHNGAGKTTTMSLLTGLFAPSSGTIEVYGRDMQTNIDDVRRELGVCMQYDVLFEHMTTKEHLLLYGQIKAPQWSPKELHEQVRTILEETDMYAHRHKRVGTLSGGMKRKLSISIAFIGGSRLVVLDEPTTGVDPCSRRNIWDIVIQYKKHRTVIMSTHHLDEAEVLSDRIAFLERGGLKCCGSPFYLKDKLGQGYKLTLTKKMQNLESERIDNAELKDFIQAHVPAARLKEAHGGDLIYSLPPFTSSNASSYRSLLTALDSNLDALQLGGYGISDTTLEEVFLQLTHGDTEIEDEVGPLSTSEMVSDTDSMDSFPSVSSGSISGFGDNIKLTGSSMVRGMALAWQQMSAILIKRFHHSRRDWKGLISQILLPILFMVFAMGLGTIRSDLRHYPEMELSPALYNLGPSFSFFSNQNPNSAPLTDSMMSFPGIDNACLDKSDNPVCRGSTNKWSSSGNSSKAFSVCKCTSQEQICDSHSFQPPHKKIPSSQTVYNLSGINVEKYLVATANDFIRNRYGGFTFGMPLPHDLKMDLRAVPKNRTLSKVWFNPEGQHTMPAYLNSLSNIILRSNLPADKDPRKYAISVSSHPYFGRPDDEDSIVQGMLQILLALCVLTGYSITTASFAIYEVNEHHSGSKRLQHISGISEPFYWAVNFFYDMVIYLIPVTLTVGVIAAFQIPAFTDRQNLAAVALLLVLFGFATFPWMYLLSGVFKDAEMAFITYVCINLFISINTIMSTSILSFLSQISLGNSQVIQDLFNSLSNAFLIFPQFNFGNGLMKLARMNIEVQLLSGYGIDAYKNPFSTDALGWMFISSFIQGVVFFTLRLLLNRFIIRKVRNLICSRKTVPQVAYEDEDEDVAAENLRVSSGAASTDILQVNQLTKVYQHLRKKVPAVKSLSVGIPAGECFGLLGVNGAGKTTTFKMLTGDVSPTDGTAQIRDWDGRLVDIMECRNKGINIGYCPQVDALDNLLTGKEHLYFYARIRGVSKREIDGVVNYLLKRLELAYHRDIITDGYSCGTRRKLSTALALIGHPQILLLDEPSSGMDPRTKRHLWKIISEEVKGKCAVVLTSHSMEECEALCSRLAIMVKGQFRCLGSLQHIKNRFGSGFTVKMYLAEASCDVEAITGFMRGRFPSTYLKDQHSTMVEYHVPIAPGGVADIFDQLESNKNALQIKHFSVSQTTLDEVFINFAMEKIAMETVPLRSEDEYDDLDSIKTVET
ncbi:uncharacterized protein abca12 isoform X7 [Sebastes umbrosus]|uniref:uncharacterized protein abca12 isoform X7 n=1 Tax=Sebastes umbrosus TaxID=72105 RepID=UPI00189D6DB6|nr:uncharacterized protein abca12 isoform X7 [Sebastes umbrosus]